MKAKGYLHLTPSLFCHSQWRKYQAKIENPDFVASYAFYPLIHAVIKQRRYKKPDETKHVGKRRKHCHKDSKSGKFESTAKLRPLHYATHFDALIYSYYASILQLKYEIELKRNAELDRAVIAYRKIKINEAEDAGKSTIHFAKEVFDEIKFRAQNSEVGVLTFDIKNFFPSLDHDLLRDKWIELVGLEEFNRHHFRVFKACTKFRYVLLNELNRIPHRNGYDETKLAKIRREKGYKCFFESNGDFRKAIKLGRLRIFKNPFYQKRKNKKVNVGIPQGLALSAVLANIYLLEFDKKIVELIVEKQKCFYRRYSDDLIIICSPVQLEEIKVEVDQMIKTCHLEINEGKTEKYIYRYLPFNQEGELRLSCVNGTNDEKHMYSTYLTYLGFEFRGYNTTIKSSNLAKYYRRIISVVKRRAKRAHNARQKNSNAPNAIFVNQIKKLIEKPLKVKDSDKNELKQRKRGNYNLVKQPNGTFRMVKFERPRDNKNSNYYGYVQRCAEIFNDTIFLHQIRKRKRITFQAIRKHLGKYKM